MLQLHKEYEYEAFHLNLYNKMHDDNGRSFSPTVHQVPFMGDLDWVDVMRAISEIGYKGHFAYEIGRAKRRPDALYQDWLHYTVKVGRGLIAMLNE